MSEKVKIYSLYSIDFKNYSGFLDENDIVGECRYCKKGKYIHINENTIKCNNCGFSYIISNDINELKKCYDYLKDQKFDDIIKDDVRQILQYLFKKYGDMLWLKK